MPNLSISKLFSRPTYRKPFNKAGKVEGASEVEGNKKKGNARRRLAGFLKKGAPCTSSKGHTIEANHPIPKEDYADDISAIVFCDAKEDDSFNYDHTSLASIPDHISRDVFEHTHTPIVNLVAAPIDDMVGAVLDFVDDVEVAQFFGPIIRQNQAPAAKVDPVEEATVVVPATAPVKVAAEVVEVDWVEEVITVTTSPSPIESYDEDDDDLGDIIDGYYSTSLADKKGCLYVSLPYKVANVMSEPEPVKVQIAKPAAFKVAAFGAIPLLDQNLIDEFIEKQGAPRRKARAVDARACLTRSDRELLKEVIEEYLKVLSKRNLENRIEEIDVAGVLSQDSKCSVMDLSSSGSECSVIASSSSGSGSVMGPSHSDNSSSPTTPSQIQAAYITESSDAELDTHHEASQPLDLQSAPDVDFDAVSTTTPTPTPVSAFRTSPTISTSRCQNPISLLRYKLNSEYRRFYTSSRPSGIPVRQRSQPQAPSQTPPESTPPRLPSSPAHFVMRWLNGMPHGSISSPANIRATPRSLILGSPVSSLRSVGKIPPLFDSSSLFLSALPRVSLSVASLSSRSRSRSRSRRPLADMVGWPSFLDAIIVLRAQPQDNLRDDPVLPYCRLDSSESSFRLANVVPTHLGHLVCVTRVCLAVSIASLFGCSPGDPSSAILMFVFVLFYLPGIPTWLSSHSTAFDGWQSFAPQDRPTSSTYVQELVPTARLTSSILRGNHQIYHRVAFICVLDWVLERFEVDGPPAALLRPVKDGPTGLFFTASLACRVGGSADEYSCLHRMVAMPDFMERRSIADE